MKKTFVTLLLAGIVFAVSAQDNKNKQQTADTVIQKKDVATLKQNLIIIQQQLHTVHMDGILRDRLDSVYAVSARILWPAPPVKDGKKP